MTTGSPPRTQTQSPLEWASRHSLTPDAGLPILESYQDPTMVSGVPVPSMDSVAKAALEKAHPAPPEPTLRKAAGELCPKSGWWFTPAKANSRRYIQQGVAFPAMEGSDYGTTFWQWSPDQSAPTL